MHLRVFLLLHEHDDWNNLPQENHLYLLLLYHQKLLLAGLYQLI
ncbi:hypothetical protein HPS12939_1376 [Glaesserella parasuis 12939]|nr:hypothetical protein [Glaesserella parasuis]EQA04358.1 hypothetical protein HPSMNH_0060 [Glaesserella parasuis MN-H]EQA05262.1 hypothetical protein HPS12939_1376 [Glaesserella parasuis 12939]MDE3990407.1 hypothetical protein [Glaesserella parasuis]MDE4054257.1 hypothetical protein [Glaesserella parasuis]MDO9777626.1 hypothetical protein [Glaesserella parasuis]